MAAGNNRKCLKTMVSAYVGLREVVLDTETTGFEPAEGHRIVEIGAVELFNHVPTGRTYHQYINPERPMPKEAFEVHGLGDDFLRDKPVFRSHRTGVPGLHRRCASGDPQCQLRHEISQCRTRQGRPAEARPGPCARYAADRPAEIPGLTGLARRAVPPLWRRQFRRAKSTAPCWTAKFWQRSIWS